MPETTTPLDLSLIPPEELRMGKEDLLADAQQLAEKAVEGIPSDCTPAMERVLLMNCMDAYRITADLIFTMLQGKKGTLH